MLLLKELQSLRSCEQRLHDEITAKNERLSTMDVLVHNMPQTWVTMDMKEGVGSSDKPTDHMKGAVPNSERDLVNYVLDAAKQCLFHIVLGTESFGYSACKQYLPYRQYIGHIH